ncbi:MAG: YcgN family cysteine cluster protein [Pseudomonadota bacterium]
MTDQFWKTKTLDEMTDAEWESLCDGCGLCCMHKIQDDDSGDIYYTNLACKLFDLNTCRCSNYAKRTKLVPDCLSLRGLKNFDWLPGSCGYRRVANGQDLLDWHPLKSGDPDAVHSADVSVKGKCLSERDTNEWTVAQKLDGA